MRISDDMQVTFVARGANRIRWSDTTWQWALAGLAVLAVVVRLAYTLIVGKNALTWGDEFTYDQLATNMLRYGCYCFIEGQSTALRAPLYPAIIALIYAMFGHSYLAVTLIQALVGGLSAPILATIGKQITRSTWIGLLAGLMFAINPLLIFTGGLLYPETLYLLLLFAIVYLWLKLADAPRNLIGIALVSGLLLGLSNLMKPNLTLFPIWLLMWGWITFRNLRWAIVIMIVIGIAMLAVMLPWSMRNLMVMGDFVLVSANSGLNLLQGNNSQVNGGALDMKYLDPLPGLSETERDTVYWQMGMDWIRSHPTDFIRLIPMKLYKFFSPLETSNRGTVITPLGTLLIIGFGIHYLLAIVGMIITMQQWRAWILPYMLILYPVFLTIVFYGGTRYGLIVQPFLMLFAAVAAVAIIERIPRLKRQIS